MKKILVPTDFSEQAEIAIDLAMQLAEKTGAAIKLVHVYEYPVATAFTTLDIGGPDPVESDYAKEMMEDCRSRLEKEVEKVSKKEFMLNMNSR